MNIVEFTKNCFPVSDYDIEEKFQEYKVHNHIKICNDLMLTRYRGAVVKGEIEPFKLIIIDEDGTEHEGIIKDNVWPFMEKIKITEKFCDLTIELI